MPNKQFHSRISQTTESIGTGNVVLSTAPTSAARVTIQSRYTPGIRLPYGIYAVDSSGNETGQWEIGEGTYLGDNILQRTVPQEGSGSLPVDFGVGVKRVTVVITPADLTAASMFGSEVTDVIYDENHGQPTSWKTGGIPHSATYEIVNGIPRCNTLTVAGVTRTVTYNSNGTFNSYS
jgi:hypothetical protein